MTVISNKAITQADLAYIVTQASSLSERLSESALSTNRLDRWCQVVAKGDWTEFQKRLQWDGMEVDKIRAISNPLPLAETQPLPHWANTLEQIIQTASEWETDHQKLSSSVSGAIDPKKPMPFEDLLLPALQVAHQQLCDRLQAQPSQLSTSAYHWLQRNLLCQLLNLCEQTLDLEFTQFRPFGYRLLSLLGSDLELPSTDTQYRAFVQQCLQNGMLGFFQKYPVLGRLLATQIDFWGEAIAEFLQRFEVDQSILQQVFQTGLGEVTEIQPNLSDAHHQGRTVMALTFASGLKLVYKPRCLSLDIAYNQLLAWLNQQGSPLPWRVLKVVDRHTHGWVEYVEPSPCQSEAAAQRFYQRSGMLLCLLHGLRTNDCHYENLIASGEHPVLIDAETLLHPEAKPMQTTAKDAILRPIYQKFWDSVLRTGLLPRWTFNGRSSYDISGLGSVDPQPLPSPAPYWKSINRDDMHRAYQDQMLPLAKNVAMLDGMPLSPNHYLDHLISGFEAFYRFLIQHRQALFASPVFAALQGQPVRFLFRTTNVYGVVLQNALAPKFLRSGLDRSIELDILARGFLTSPNKPSNWSIFHAELNALEQLDIPYFSTNSDGTVLDIGSDRPAIHDYFTAPSFTQVSDRLQRWDESDLSEQINLIRASFSAKVAQSSETDSTISRITDYSAQPLTQEQLLSAASAIADQIADHAIRQSDSSVYWVGLDYIAQAERFQLQPLGMSLCNGSCGIALFLAALDAVRGTDEFCNLTLGALQNLREIVQMSDAKSKSQLAQRIGIGGITGLGSMIYSLVKISLFLKGKVPDDQQKALLQDAFSMAQVFTPELIADDRQFDIMSGAAGAILGLLALYHATADSTVLEKAICCGQHLLTHRTRFEGLPPAWKNFADRPLTGFSHGAAGIAYALLQLNAVAPDPEYLSAAREGIGYEHQAFLPTAANWADFRSSQEVSNLMVSWCNGAAGIGLGRLGGLSQFASEMIDEEIAIALQTTQNYGLGVDHLCCGNFGRIELLLVAAQTLSRPELLELAKQQAAWIIARSEQRGGYVLTLNSTDSTFSPSFFAGVAGIGYELLRLAFPKALPSVLLLQ